MPTIPIDAQIDQAYALSVRLEFLLIGKPHKTKTTRDHLCLRYWSLILETHQGIILLLKTKHYGPAFALMRPMVEAFLRLNLVMYGTERQRQSLRDGTYNTDFVAIGDQIDTRLGFRPVFGPWFKKHKDTLHGFTHGDREQLARRGKGRDIVATYPASEVRDVIIFTNLFALLTATMTMDFLGCTSELQTALGLMHGHLQSSTKKRGPRGSKKAPAAVTDPVLPFPNS